MKPVCIDLPTASTPDEPWRSDALWDFVERNATADPARLLLRGDNTVDVRFAALQIEGRQRLQHKLPTLVATRRFAMARKVNGEQCSSEATAHYKATLLSADSSVADITGGMGVDTWCMAQQVRRVLYVERDEWLCRLARYNFDVLGCRNVEVMNADSTEWLQACHERFDVVYADPARRDGAGRRVYALDDCVPNLLPLRDRLAAVAPRLLVKASPMADIDALCRQLAPVARVHILSVEGECKELLVEATTTSTPGCEGAEPPRVMVGLTAGGEVAYRHEMTQNAEQAAEPLYATRVGRYLYDPDAALMKGGAFRSLCGWYGVAALSRNTHLYTADHHLPLFAGRCFEVLGELRLRAREVRIAVPEGRAHVMCSNYPVSAEALQRQLGLREGGTLFVVATTVAGRKTGLLCRRVC